MTFPFPVFVPQTEPILGWYALAHKATDDQPSFSSGVVTFDGEISDDQNIHDTVTANSKFIIPAAWNGRYGIMKTNIELSDSGSATVQLNKGGSTFSGGGRRDSSTAGNQLVNLTSAPVPIATGNEFEVYAAQSLSVGLDPGEATWASFELMPSTFAGALAIKSGSQSLPAANTLVTFTGTDVYDTNSYHDESTNTSRMTTQSGDAIVILYGGIETLTSSTGQIFMDMLKNGSSFLGQPRCDAESTGQDYLCAQSAVLAVTGGTDYFEMQAFHTVTTTIEATSHTYFAIRVLPSDTEYAFVSLASDFALAANVTTTVSWGTKNVDTSGFFDAGSPTVFTIPSGKDGWYEISANLTFVSAPNQSHGLIIIDGAAAVGMAYCDTDTAGTDAVNLVTAPLYLTAGQTVSVQGYQANGGDVDAGNFTWFCIRRIVPPTS